MGGSFVIVSLKHTRPRDPFVTFWRPSCKGYCWPLSWAGLYSEEEARAIVRDGEDSVMVPWSAAIALAAPPKKGLVDGDAGPVITRRKLSWLLAFACPAENSPSDMAAEGGLPPLSAHDDPLNPIPKGET